MKVFEFDSNFGFNALYSQIDFIGKCLNEGRKQYLIVPDRFSLSMEKLVMERLNLVSSFDISVLSFSRMANLVVGNIKTKKVLSVLDAVIITQYILKKNKEKLKCFTKIPASTGFAKVLFDSISQLKSCKITPGMLKYSASKQTNENLKAKIEDIALVYELYEGFIQDRFMDSSNKLTLLCERMGHSGLFDNSDIHFCNFLDFTNQDYDVIKEAIKCANLVSFSVVDAKQGQNNREIYVSVVKERIKEICEELDVKVELEKSSYSLQESQNHILNNLFSLEQNVLDIPPQIELYSSSTKEEEMLFVVKRILSLVENGAKFGDFCVVCSDINDYKNVALELFQRYKLPFWIDQNISLEETEYYKFIKQNFDAVIYGYQTDDVLKIAQNVFSDLSENQKEDFYVFAKKFGIIGSMWKEDFSLKNVDEKFFMFMEQKKLFMAPICVFEQKLKNSKTIYDFCESAKFLIEKMNLKEKAENLSVYFEKKGDLRQSSIFRQSPEKVEKILEQMCEVLGEEEISLDEWLEMFLVSVSATEIAPIPMGINNVLIGQMLSTIFEPKKFYFVVGATSSKLPAFVKDVGIISDMDILSLSDLNISPTINDINRKTVFTVLQNFCLWENKLIVTMPRNIQKTQNEPSKVFDDLQNMFTVQNSHLKIVNTEKLMQDEKVFLSSQKRLKFLLKTSSDVLSFVARNKDKLSEKEKSLLMHHLNSQNMDFILNGGVYPEYITNAQNLFFVDGHTKATEIERYFSCPFLHFVEYGLKLKNLEENKIRPVDVGNILHDVCERYAKYSKGQILEDKKIEQVASMFFDEIMQKKEFEHLMLGPQSRALSGGLKQEAIRICKALNYHNKHSKYKIAFAEKSFGEKDFASMPDICVYGSKKVLKMRGKVDRVDVFSNKFRVVDYKTGKAKSEFKMLDLYMGKKMQLFIYLYAIMSSYKDKIPTGAFYFPIHNEYLDEVPSYPYQNYCMNGVTIDDYDNFVSQDDLVDYENSKSGIIGFSLDAKKETREKGILQMKKTPNAVSQKGLYAMINYSYKLMSKALSEILNGHICPKPTSDACLYCSAKTFCPFKNNGNDSREKNFDVENENFFEEVLKNA